MMTSLLLYTEVQSKLLTKHQSCSSCATAWHGSDVATQHVPVQARHLRGCIMPQPPYAQMMGRTADLTSSTMNFSDAAWDGMHSSAIRDCTCHQRGASWSAPASQLITGQ